MGGKATLSLRFGWPKSSTSESMQTLSNGYQVPTNPATEAGGTALTANWEKVNERLPRHNFAASSDPTVDDDSADGYVAGSQWHNTLSGAYFKCFSGASGAAIWFELQSGSLSAKADKVVGAVDGNLAALNGSGNLTDSGSAPSDFALAAEGLASVVDDGRVNLTFSSNVLTLDASGVPILTGDNAFTGENTFNGTTVVNGDFAAFGLDAIFAMERLTLLSPDGIVQPQLILEAANGNQWHLHCHNDRLDIGLGLTDIVTIHDSAPADSLVIEDDGTITGTFAGDGSALTALDATALVGLVPADNLGNDHDLLTPQYLFNDGTWRDIEVSDLPDLPQSKITDLSSDLAALAPIASPSFTGTATAASLAVTSQITNTVQALTDAATVTWNTDAGPIATLTLGGNRTLANPTNLRAGGTYILVITQDGTGNRTLAYGTNYKFPGGTAPTLSTAAGAVDILTLFSPDGTIVHGVLTPDFS